MTLIDLQGQLFFSENKRSLLFMPLIESPPNLTKGDIADDLWWPFKVISSNINGFIVCAANVQYILYNTKSVTAVGCHMWAVISTAVRVNDAENDQLASAKFLAEIFPSLRNYQTESRCLQ